MLLNGARIRVRETAAIIPILPELIPAIAGAVTILAGFFLSWPYISKWLSSFTQTQQQQAQQEEQMAQLLSAIMPIAIIMFMFIVGILLLKRLF